MTLICLRFARWIDDHGGLIILPVLLGLAAAWFLSLI